VLRAEYPLQRKRGPKEYVEDLMQTLTWVNGGDPRAAVTA